MNQAWSDTDLNKSWVLSKNDFRLLNGRSVSNRIAVAVQLKHYQIYACFIDDDISLVGSVVLEFVVAQIGATASSLEHYDCHGRTGRHQRKKILTYLQVTPFVDSDEPEIKEW